MCARRPWLKLLPSPEQRCQGGSIFSLLVQRIELIALGWVETIINSVIKGVNSFLKAIIGWLGFQGFPLVCWAHAGDPSRCDEGYWGEHSLDKLIGCPVGDATPIQDRCYYKRQKAICMDDGDRVSRYYDLFAAPSTAELDQQFKDAAGDLFDAVPPTFKALMSQISSAQENTEAQSICDGSLWDSMDLDEARATEPSFPPTATPPAMRKNGSVPSASH